MKFLAEAVLSFFEILEAEGRALRKNAVRLSLALPVFLAAGAMLTAAMSLMLAGIYCALREALGAVGALFATGALAGVAALFFFAAGLRIAGGGRIGTEDEKDDGREGGASGVEGEIQAVDGAGEPGEDRQGTSV